MQPVLPFFREAGAGPGVVCLHSNASSSNQWRALMDRLAPGFHVLAADGYGAGKSPAWRGGRALGLHDEAALMETVFARAGEPFALVLTGEQVITLPKALASFFLFQQPNWGQLGAIGIVATAPLLVISYYMQRFLIRSFSVELGGR